MHKSLRLNYNSDHIHQTASQKSQDTSSFFLFCTGQMKEDKTDNG